MKSILIAALTIGAASLVLAQSPAPLCRVQANATRAGPPGMYTVRVTTTTTLQGAPCPPDGYALVQLESGRIYPVAVVTPDRPFRRAGIPWYWVLTWHATSGKRYPVPIRNFDPPFSP